ncbi:calcium-activated BK potassium channel alpha subunit-domain-containing protein [Dissophora ornata]|nr:calcium-activated BK potassium channel alpha subunit-domain-containing protein [Dissophora ornata]
MTTLLAWSLHLHAPDTRIFTYNLLPETETFQWGIVEQSMCISDVKQLLLAYNCRHRGTATLILNLLHPSEPANSYDDGWQAQYGDGTGNELYVCSVPEVFIGWTFAQVSWFVFQEFQSILIGVDIFLRPGTTGSSGDGPHFYHLSLNPGNSYRLGKFDQLVFIAQSPDDLEAIVSFKSDQYERLLKDEKGHLEGSRSDFSEAMETYHPAAAAATANASKQRHGATQTDNSSLGLDKSVALVEQLAISTQGPIPKTDATESSDAIKENRDTHDPLQSLQLPGTSSTHGSLRGNSAQASLQPLDETTYIGQTSITRSETKDLPLCHLLISPPDSVKPLIRDDLSSFKNHIVVCANVGENLYRFLAILSFPRVFWVAGNCRHQRDLVRAGILGASSIVVMSHSVNGLDRDEFADSTAIMAHHMVYQTLQQRNLLGRQHIVVEILERSNIRFLNFLKGKGSSGLSVGPSGFWMTPIFASGQVLVTSLLDNVLFQAYSKTHILDLVKLCCGVRFKQAIELDQILGIDCSNVCLIETPPQFVGKSFLNLFQALSLKDGIIPLGLYRAPDRELNNALPFVFTNPLPGILLKNTDMVYVLKS